MDGLRWEMGATEQDGENGPPARQREAGNRVTPAAGLARGGIGDVVNPHRGLGRKVGTARDFPGGSVCVSIKDAVLSSCAVDVLGGAHNA